MPETFGTLLQKTWTTIRGSVKPILIGSLVFGIALTTTESMLTDAATRSVQDRFGAMNTEKMEELSERIESGDEEAFQEMMMELGVVGDSGKIDEEKMEHMATGFMMSLMPSFGLFAIVMMIISLVATTYFWVLALHESEDALSIAKKTPTLIVPMLGVWVWSFLRSFAWIPFIGIIPAIVLGPRFAFASIILIKEKKGVVESVALSYERTRGYWGKIVGNGLLMILCLFVAAIIVEILVRMIGVAVPMSALVLKATVTYIYTAAMTIFIVHLAKTVMAHPLRPQKVL